MALSPEQLRALQEAMARDLAQRGADQATVAEFLAGDARYATSDHAALVQALDQQNFLSGLYPAAGAEAAPGGESMLAPNFQQALDLGLITPIVEPGLPPPYGDGSPTVTGYELSPLASLYPQSYVNQLLGIPGGGGGGGQVDTPLDISAATGFFGGEPTLEREAFEAQRDLALRQFIAGLSSEAFQRPLQQAGISGYFGGLPTLAREQFLSDQGLAQQNLNQQALQTAQQGALAARGLNQEMTQAEMQDRLERDLANQQTGFQTNEALGFFGDRPTLNRQLGMGRLALDTRAQNIDLIRNPTNFIAAQLLSRGPGAQVGDLQFPGAVGNLLFGGELQPIRTPQGIAPPSLQSLNRALPGELAAAGAGFQYLTGMPEETFFGAAEQQGLRSF